MNDILYSTAIRLSGFVFFPRSALLLRLLPSSILNVPIGVPQIEINDIGCTCVCVGHIGQIYIALVLPDQTKKKQCWIDGKWLVIMMFTEA